MNLSTKIGTLILASAMSLGASTNASAQGGGFGALGTTQGITIAAAVGIGVLGAVAISSAGNDNNARPPVTGDGGTGGGGGGTTTTTGT